MIMNWKLLDVDIGNTSPYKPRQKNIAPLAVAAIGAGASILGGLAGTAMQNSANASMDRETREWQELMWAKNNNYNLPVNQRKRLEDAGINPALAMSNGNMGVASSAPSAVQHTPADFSGIGSGISSGAQYFLQAQQVEANNELSLSQAESYRIANMTRLQESLADIEVKIADAKKKGADTRFLEWQLDKDKSLYDAYSKKAYADIQNIQADSALKSAQIREVSLRADYQSIINRYEIPNREKVLRNLDAEYKNILASAAAGNASAAYSYAQKALTDVNADTAKKIQKDVVERAFQEVESIKDKREIDWLLGAREMLGEGKRLPNGVGEYEMMRGYGQAVKQNKRRLHR